MLNQVELLTFREDPVGKALTGILVKRALIEVLVRNATAANELLSHARYQLSLVCSKDNSKPALLQTAAIEALRPNLNSLVTALESVVQVTEELDEFKVVIDAPAAVAGLALLLEDNRRRFEEVRKLINGWQQALDKAAHV